VTELEHKAAEAWRAVSQGSGFFDRAFGVKAMPAAVAIDMVQDVCGDRDDAVAAILDAAGAWLAAQVPAADMSNAKLDAVAVIGDLRAEAFDLADSLRVAIGVRAMEVRLRRAPEPPATQDERDAAMSWSVWCARADLAVRLGRKVAAAAYPIEEGTVTQ
jgi:hypothetical protein